MEPESTAVSAAEAKPVSGLKRFLMVAKEIIIWSWLGALGIAAAFLCVRSLNSQAPLLAIFLFLGSLLGQVIFNRERTWRKRRGQQVLLEQQYLKIEREVRRLQREIDRIRSFDLEDLLAAVRLGQLYDFSKDEQVLAWLLAVLGLKGVGRTFATDQIKNRLAMLRQHEKALLREEAPLNVILHVFCSELSAAD